MNKSPIEDSKVQPAVVLDRADSMAINHLFNVVENEVFVAESNGSNAQFRNENTGADLVRRTSTNARYHSIFAHLKLAKNEQAAINEKGQIEITRTVDDDCEIKYIYGEELSPKDDGPQIKINDIISGNIPFRANVSLS